MARRLVIIALLVSACGGAPRRPLLERLGRRVAEEGERVLVELLRAVVAELAPVKAPGL